MTNADRPLDAPLLELTDDSLARPMPAALAAARADALAAAADLLAIPEAALTKPWDWIGGSVEEVRYGAYRAAEALEKAEVEARSLAAAADAAETRAGRIVGPATAARWDLVGVLLALPEDVVSADPGGGEWSVRQVMGHVITSQRGYGWGTAWWLAQGFALDGDVPDGAPDEFWAPMPEEEDEAATGSAIDLRARLDTILDLAAERLAGVPDERLEVAARWSGYVVPAGFRVARWPSHLREHTIQVDKTLVMLGRVPSEPERLVRNLLAAYGRAESAVFGRRPSEAAVLAAADRVAAGAAEARDAIASARAAAEA